jgi:hypothetical protein
VLVVAAGPASAFDLNCEDFASQAEAQEVYDANPDDPNDLDADDDGQACEEFTYGADPSATPTTAPATTPTAAPTAGVSTTPAGGVATGDGSTAGTDPGTLPFLVGGLGLVAAGGAAFAARRSARGSV